MTQSQWNPALHPAQLSTSDYIVAWTKYVVYRGLETYASRLGPEFCRRLGTLRPGEVWLDVGAGQGSAQADYVKWVAGKEAWSSQPHAPLSSVPATVVACDCCLPEGGAFPPLGPGPTRRFVAKRAEHLSLADLGGRQASLVTDLFGALSYCSDFSGVLSILLNLLQPGGLLCVLLSVERTYITSGHRLREYCENIEGARLMWLRHNGMVQGKHDRVQDLGHRLIMQRSEGKVTVPHLECSHFGRGNPPMRSYAYPDHPPSGLAGKLVHLGSQVAHHLKPQPFVTSNRRVTPRQLVD